LIRLVTREKKGGKEEDEAGVETLDRIRSHSKQMASMTECSPVKCVTSL